MKQELNDYLVGILKQKRLEVDQLIQETEDNPSHPLNLLESAPPSGRFTKALLGNTLSIIAEVKRRSPALGALGVIADPIALAKRYCKGGASAISVLTDQQGFGGCLTDLEQVSKAIDGKPTLRKDFIIHPLQLAEAKLAGAAAALLIVRVVGNDLKFLLKEATRLGLETVTEINDVDELAFALDAGASIIALNHRNLRTFEVDIALSDIIAPLMPDHVVKIAASGISTPEHACHMRHLGYDAILVGEALVRSQDPAKLISQLKEGGNAR